jgi:phage terminase small subunit
MEPLTTTAIIAALTAGVARSAGGVGEKVFVDGYEALKALLRRKFGGESNVVKAVEHLEANPESEGRQLTLNEEARASKVDEDPDVLQAARSLLDQLAALPGAQSHVQHASGSYIAQADRHSTAQVHVGKPSDPKS